MKTAHSRDADTWYQTTQYLIS